MRLSGKQIAGIGGVTMAVGTVALLLTSSKARNRALYGVNVLLQGCGLQTPVSPTLAIDAPRLVEIPFDGAPTRTRMRAGTTDDTFDGTGQLSWTDPDGQISVFLAAAGGVALPNPCPLSAADLHGGCDLYIEGVRAATPVQAVRLTLGLQHPSRPIGADVFDDATIAYEVDIIVVGCGAAGLGAAQHLIAAGKTLRILEGRDRNGGRAYTQDVNGAHFDHGCHWMHSGDTVVHPWHEAHRTLTGAAHVAYVLGPDPDRDYLVHNGAHAPDVDGPALFDLFVELEEAIEAHGGPLAASVATAAHNADPQYAMACAMIGALDEGTEVANFSMLDKCRVVWDANNEGSNEIPAEGYGQLICDYADYLAAQHGGQLQIINSTVVETITRDGGVLVATDVGGPYRARGVIVTVPTGVLNNGDIAFVPPLPPAVTQAIQHLPMGNFKKILLEFNAAVLGGNPANVYPFSNNEQTVWRFITEEPAPNFITVIVGGVLADNLDALADGVVVTQAVAQINGIVGHDVTGQLVASSVTHWGADPFSRGAYTYGVPGHENARGQVANAALDELWFAGEAYIETAYATAHGAYTSGVQAATRAVAEIL